MEWFEQWDLDRLTDGGWVSALAAAVLSIGLASGLVTWFKGRKLLAVLVWMLLTGVAASLTALSLGVSELIALDRTTLMEILQEIRGNLLPKKTFKTCRDWFSS